MHSEDSESNICNWHTAVFAWSTKVTSIKATKTNVFIPWNHQHTLLVSKSSALLLAKQSPSSLQKTHWWLDKTVCKNDKKGKINTVEALLTSTLISGQLNLWPPSQNPVSSTPIQTLYFTSFVSSQLQLWTPFSHLRVSAYESFHCRKLSKNACNRITFK